MPQPSPRLSTLPYTTLFRSGCVLDLLGQLAADRIGDIDLAALQGGEPGRLVGNDFEDRKSTRLNSSHSSNSYAVFCLQTIIRSRRRGVGAARGSTQKRTLEC